MIHKFTVRPSSPEALTASEHLARIFGLRTLVILKDYYIETERGLTASEVESIGGLLCDPLLEKVVFGQELKAGRSVQVAHHRSTVDNENDSVVALCKLAGVDAVAAKLATTYESNDDRLIDVVRARAFNANIQEIHTSEPSFESLQPVGRFLAARTFDLCGMSDDELAALGKQDGRNLDLRQMKQIRTVQERTKQPQVTDVLLESLDARWSDHCSHSTWRSLGNLLRKLVMSAERTANSNIVSMFHDNAGVWHFYDDWCLALKAETHNGPSAISAYFGQLTKLGGVLRDVLGTGQGADPIGAFEYTATGLPSSPAPLTNRPTPKQIAHDTIRAIKEYANTFGVPMMWSRMAFMDRYRAKPFALGGCVGLVPRKFANKGRPAPGDLVILIGGLTGNEGIHGASASSIGSTMDEAAVQIGSPLEEVKFRQAIIDLRDAECIRAITDVGGAGLNSAVGEMGDPTGVWINTALVPLKTAGLPMWRILLSESQERMVLAIAPEKLLDSEKILERHAVRHAVIGRFTNTACFCVVHDAGIDVEAIVSFSDLPIESVSELGFNVPYELLNDEPEAQEAIQPKPGLRQISAWPNLVEADVPKIVCALVSDSELADQSWASSQYDTTVQGCTYYGPYSGGPYGVPTSYWASTPVFGKPYAAVFATSFNPWLFQADPQRASRQLLLSLLQTQVLAGVNLTDICLCDNFYTPDVKNGAAWALVSMVSELADLAELYGTPFISGKDSSAGSTVTDEGIVDVPPAVFLSALGKVANCELLRPNEWQRAGNVLVQIGPECASLAGTVAARIFNAVAEDVDDVDSHEYKRYLNELSVFARGAMVSARPIGTGGIFGSLILGSLASSVGVEVLLEVDNFAELLKEHRCGAVIEISEDELSKVPPILNPRVIGRLIEKPRQVLWLGRNVLTPDSIDRWRNSFQESLQ
jgi:phosphoribosylformylglycinamidine synthase